MKPLEIRESKGGELSIPGLSFVEVISTKEVINYLAEGIKVNSIYKLEQSHKLHTRQYEIFKISFDFPCQVWKTCIEWTNRRAWGSCSECTFFIIKKLRIVDLAGSEKFNVPHDCPPAEKEIKSLEIKSINGSLSKLGHCISVSILVIWRH